MGNKGLREQILTAKSADEVAQLISTGQTYGFASRRTRNGWKSASRRTLAWLKGEKVSAPVEVVQEEVEHVTKKRGNKKKLNPAVV